MEYIRATESDTEEIYRIVQDTIRTVYPRYYPEEVVEFFLRPSLQRKYIQGYKRGVCWRAVCMKKGAIGR